MAASRRRSMRARSVGNVERPRLLTLALSVDAAVLAVWFGYGLIASRGGSLLFAPLFLTAAGVVYACWALHEFALVLRGAWAVSLGFHALTAIGPDGVLRAAALAWSVVALAGCLQGWRALRRHGKRSGAEDRSSDSAAPLRGRHARRWRPIPRPPLLTGLLCADFIVLGTSFTAWLLAIARRPGGLLLILFAHAAPVVLDLLAWQMHRVGLLLRAAVAVLLVLVAIFVAGPLTAWTAVAAVHAAVSCWVVSLALRALDARPADVPVR